MNEPRCIWNAQAALGEGPIWSAKEQALYWVDILNHRLHRYAPGHKQAQRTWQFNQEISAASERLDAEGLIVSLRHGFAFFDPATEKLRTISQVEADLPGNRFNDGKCDARGRFWAGTMDFNGKLPTGSLYRLDANLETAKMDGGYPVTNGPAWSADCRIMYYNDSVHGKVYAFDFDLEKGEISNKRLFLQFTHEDGSPDGMTTDVEGGIWIAHWGAGKVTRHAPDGEILQTIMLPCSQITSCAFGGHDLKTLFITSAAHGLSPQQLACEPLAGGLFAIELDIAGMPANAFAG